jgi:L-seryl-tRNA(Ser) seleniumtransferase
VLAMLGQSEAQLQARAARLQDGIGRPAQAIRTLARVGGGALPLTELEGPAVALQVAGDPVTLAARLRAADPPVIARINDGRVVLDPRTLAEDEIEAVIAAVRQALAGG